MNRGCVFALPESSSHTPAGTEREPGRRCIAMRVLIWAVALTTAAFWDGPVASSVLAQDSAEPDKPSALESIVERVRRLERELEALKKTQRREIPDDPQAQRIVPMLETPFLGRYYIYSGPRNSRNSRYFLAKLTLVNLTPKAVEIRREDIQLRTDGELLPISNVSDISRLRNNSVSVGNQHIQLRNVKTAKLLKIPPGRMRSTWLFFDQVEDGNHVPEMQLEIEVDEKTVKLDVNAIQKEALALEINRIGPRGSLGLLTIGGPLNTVSVGSLMDELDQLASEKVVRIVLRWSEAAPEPEQSIFNWIMQSIQSGERQRMGDSQFPPIPATIREFHLCKPPESQSYNRGRLTRYATAGRHIHQTEAAAVEAALESAFQSLPRDELLTSIEQGQLLSRAAALSTGGGRLAEDKLPIILQYADDDELLLQQAALKALRHFGDQQAIATLVRYVKKNTDPLASTAIDSLAGSRYGAAHDALLEIMNNEPPSSQKKIVKVLAAHPRPVWSDAIFRFVKDPREGLNQEALQALTQVGHPQLIGALNEALQARDEELNRLAFKILAERTDPESEAVAVPYALAQLEQDDLDARTLTIVLNLMNRVKDQRAVPLLIKQFPEQSNKHALIRTLALLGDEHVAEFFVEKFPTLASQEKAEVLTALRSLHSPKFQELATTSLLSENHSLVRAAAQGLSQDGSPEAMGVLINALKQSGNPTSWNEVCKVLGLLSTPEARNALLEARDQGNERKRESARSALTQIYQRSPAYQHFSQAQAFEKKNKLAEALKLYDQAVKVDPQLPWAFSGRANLFLKQGKYAEAGPDFQKVLDLDPWDSQALTGLCIVMVVHEGKPDEAIKKLEAQRKKFKNGYLFSYNAACVYARVVEQLKKDVQAEGAPEKISAYTQQALTDLKASVKRGFSDLKWMREDPDLKTLHDLPEFQKVSQMTRDES